MRKNSKIRVRTNTTYVYSCIVDTCIVGQTRALGQRVSWDHRGENLASFLPGSWQLAVNRPQLPQRATYARFSRTKDAESVPSLASPQQYLSLTLLFTKLPFPFRREIMNPKTPPHFPRPRHMLAGGDEAGSWRNLVSVEGWNFSSKHQAR